jgi:hypothetical protein
MARSARRSVSAPVQFIPTVCPVSFPSRISHRTLHGHERRARFFRPSGAGNAEKLRTLGLRASFGSGPPRTPPPRTSRRHTPTKNTMVRHRPREPSSPPRARLDRRAPARSRAPRSRATADVTTARARSRLTSFVAADRRPPPPNPPPPNPPSRAPRRTPSSPRPSSPSRRPIPMCTPSCRRRSSARCASSRAPRVLSLPRRRSRRPPPSPKHRATSVAGASVGGEETSRRDRPRSIPRSIAPGLPARSRPARRASRRNPRARAPTRPRPPRPSSRPPRRPEPNPPPRADAFSRSVPFPDGSFPFVPAPAARASSSSRARTSRPPP